ncbi:hypothetical protein HMPREF9347_04938 [Escherichia coli MS 124-1]|nr:hypothetical protein HMPREF9347_04938 [Escherichia coli MS 124-1]
MSGRSPDQMAIVIASRVTVLQLHILSRFSGHYSLLFLCIIVLCRRQRQGAALPGVSF